MPDPPPILYHYTSPAGLKGIVEEESLRCSSVHHLSDAEEISYALNEARPFLTEIQHELRGQHEFEGEISLLDRMTETLGDIEDQWVFVGSFSAHGNQLSQWRAYCPDQGGYSIGFDGERLAALAAVQGFDLVECVYTSRDYWPELERLVLNTLEAYRTGRNKDQPEDELESECVNYFRAHLARLASQVKHPSFEEEDEWRLVSAPYVDALYALEFREGASFLVPYIGFPMAVNYELEAVDVDFESDDLRLPISEIIVGPTPHPEVARLSAHMLCNQAGVWPEFELSEIPYRTW